ncbi:MAG: DUF5678 domain-containing protein [Anaerolineales bacterium]|nr:DUF5678 domain-containing protein [Anaerolineales bacterium]
MDKEPDHSEKLHSSYAGRWVALVRGRVIAQGGTPEQALRASQSSRYNGRDGINLARRSSDHKSLFR